MTQGLKNEKSKYYSEVAFTRRCENMQSYCHQMLTGDKGRSLYVIIDDVSFYWMTSIHLNAHYRIVRGEPYSPRSSLVNGFKSQHSTFSASEDQRNFASPYLKDSGQDKALLLWNLT